MSDSSDVEVKIEKRDKKDKKDKKEKKDKKDKKDVSDAPVVEKSKKRKHVSDSEEDEVVHTKAQKKTSVSSAGQSEFAAYEEAIMKKKSGPTVDRTVADENGNPPLISFNLCDETIDKLYARGITHLFPIQAATFEAISSGKDMVGRARTGTGKTLAFALPLIEAMLKNSRRKAPRRAPLAVILSPTRELSLQIAQDFELTAPSLTTTCIYGGTSMGPQFEAFRNGVDIVVGTCGRVKDMLEKESALSFSDIQFVVLDEADEMLNMGFQEEVETILSYVPKGQKIQTLLFSATMPEWVKKVASKYLQPDYETVDLIKDQKLQASTNVEHLAIPCHWEQRNQILGDIILCYGGHKAKTIIFVNTKKEANDIIAAGMLESCQTIHGDIPQAQREATLAAFRDCKFNVLLATDVAARGIDIPNVELVIQLEPPQSVETYVHRSGRTGRANKTGKSIIFFTQKQVWGIQNIERVTKMSFNRVGVPSRGEIIKSSAYGALERLLEVSEQVLPLFEDKAKGLIEQKGALWVVSAALAVISGNTEAIKERSLLSTSDKYVTVHIHGNEILRALTPIWHVIRRYVYPENADDKVRMIKFTADKKGAVFEIPVEDKDMMAAVQDKYFTVEIPDKLPELVEREGERPDKPRWMQAKYGSGGDRGGDRRGGGDRGGDRRGGGDRGGSRYGGRR